MTTAVPSKTDLMYEVLYNPKFVPLPSPKVNVKTTTVDGKPSYLMKNHATGIYYDLDELTNLIWNLTDGKRTVTQIIKEVQRQKPRVQERTVIEILLFFAEANLLVSSLELAPKKRFRVVSPFEIDLTLIKDSNTFLQSLHSKIKPIFKRFLLWVTVVFIIVGAVWFAGEFVSIYGKKANFEIMGSSVVGFFFYYFVAMAPVIAIHEIAHAMTLVHYGGKAGEMGTGLLYFGPMFYTETTDAWGLSKRNRMMVYLAGNITTLFTGAILVAVHYTVNIPEPASHILLMVAFYCFIMALMNFAPPFETDGYYVLTDVVGNPNLRRDSYGYLGSLFKRAFGRKPKTEAQGLTKRKKWIFLGYALLSVGWIIYIVFQSSLFLVYMGQDVTIALGSIFQSVLTAQAVEASAIIIAIASVLYFGMQLVGYGFVFSAAVKKTTAKPLQIEAIHDRDLAVFAYLPPQVPESLSNSLKAKMKHSAKKFTQTFEIKQVGRSCIAILRIGGANLALVQIKEHLKKVESEFNSAYQDLVTNNKELLQTTVGIYAPQKVKLTNMLDQIAAESVNAGNSGALSIVKLCEKGQNENLLCLLFSAFGTVWTIEVQPAQEYDIEKELLEGMLLEDLTLTDLYNDTENFKKRVVYGFDSLAKLATEIDAGVKEGLARPETYQLVSTFEPIKNRIVLVGRTEETEKRIDAFTPIFIAQTWSGYVDSVLSEACFKLSTLGKARLPSAKEIKEMSTAELATLSRDFSALAENHALIEKCLQESEDKLQKINQDFRELKATLKPSESPKMGMIEAVLRVNTENMKSLPKRIAEFRKEWKAIRKRIEDVREHVEKDYNERKTGITKKKHRMLKMYPLTAALSIIFLILSFQPPLTSWWIPLLSIAIAVQALYIILTYNTWRSFDKVTKYPSHAFNMVQLFMLSLTEAIYGYVITEDVLTPI